MKLTIGRKLGLNSFIFIVLFIILGIIIFVYNRGVTINAVNIGNDDLLGAIYSLSMLEEIGDMNSNLLEYMLGETEERDEFTLNYEEFYEFFEKLKPLEKSDADVKKMKEIERLIKSYIKVAEQEVFSKYEPDTEKWANAQLDKIEKKYGAELESILDKAKEEEILDSKNTTDLAESINDDLPGIRYYLELIDEAGDMLENVARYVGGEHDEKDDFEANAETFLLYLEKLKPLEKKEKEIDDIIRIQNLYNKIKSISEDIFSRYSPRKKFEAIAAIDRIEHDYFDKLESILENMVLEEQEDAKSGMEELISDLRITGAVIIFGMIIVLVGGIAAALMITNSITVPLNEALTVTDRLSKGDLGALILTDRKDETGQLLTSMKNMVEKLRGIVNEVRQSSDNVASGSRQLSTSAEMMAQGASEQAGSAEQVSASMEEMTVSIRQNAENAQQTEKIAIQSAVNARKSGDEVAKTVNAMKVISEKISIIEDIARQTDLLALNAAVEAARAGDHGKGFAVVAGDVRKLAERSRTAAAEINKLSNSSMEIAENAGEMLSKLVPDIQKTSELVQEISASSSEQNAGAQQVNNAIQQLDQIIQQNVASSEEIASTSQELSTQADLLRKTISFFKTDIRETLVYEKAEMSTSAHNTNNDDKNSVENESDENYEQQKIKMEEDESDCKFEKY